MTFDTAIFIVCILVINAFIFAAMRSPRICAIIFGESLLAVPYFLLGYVYDGLPRYPQPHRIIGFCNYVPRIMNNTDLCPGSGLHPDGSYITTFAVILQCVWREYVPREKCTVGACVSAIRKSWDIIQIANRGARKGENETVEDIMIRINRIQRNLGVHPYRFQELEEIGYYNELAEDEARQRIWEDEDDDERVIHSEEEAQLRHEEIESMAEVDDW